MEKKKQLIAFILFAVILISIVILLVLFCSEEGNEFLHKHTNIVCNLNYDEDIDGWMFEANSTKISNFINECKSRGIGI